MDIYEPAEDSFLLQKYIKKYSCVDSVLDMGTGSGIQAITASKHAQLVVAADINPNAIDYAKKKANGVKNIRFIVSDLFSNVPKKKFDIILFNPPYLPPEKGIEDVRLFSEKGGSKTITDFLDRVNDYLETEGTILLIYSSLTKQSFIKVAIDRNLLTLKIIEKVHRFFEDIVLVEIKKSDLLKKIEGIGVSEPHVFAHGSRGVIIKAKYKGQDVAIKAKKDANRSQGSIANEARFLRILNKHDIGPRLLLEGDELIVYKFVEGVFIQEFIQKNSTKDILLVIKRIFSQLLEMDKLGINKFEMHRPVKHILIKDNIPVLIDFERARFTQNPKNVTQFCDFLRDLRILLEEKGIYVDNDTLIDLSREYKKTRKKSLIKQLCMSLK